MEFNNIIKKILRSSRRAKILGIILVFIPIITIVTAMLNKYNFESNLGYYRYNFFRTSPYPNPLLNPYPNIASDVICENCSLKIPKIIHRIWMVFDPIHPEIPEVYKKFDQRLKELHPDWQIIEWNPLTILAFIKQYYPDFLPTYYSYVAPVQRVDVARYLILDHYGGLMIQHSFYVNKPLEPLIRGYEFVATVENIESFMLNPGFCASIPKHPILSKIIKNLPLRAKAFGNKNQHSVLPTILTTTGPIAFSDMVYGYLLDNINDKSVQILTNKFVYPFFVNNKQYEPIWSHCIANQERCVDLYPDAYAFTLWSASWWWIDKQ
jgi:mannosyltransferase OCH1-like enzyme